MRILAYLIFVCLVAHLNHDSFSSEACTDGSVDLVNDAQTDSVPPNVLFISMDEDIRSRSLPI